jgi:hypothetical protein
MEGLELIKTFLLNDNKDNTNQRTNTNIKNI